MDAFHQPKPQSGGGPGVGDNVLSPNTKSDIGGFKHAILLLLSDDIVINPEFATFLNAFN